MVVYRERTTDEAVEILRTDTESELYVAVNGHSLTRIYNYKFSFDELLERRFFIRETEEQAREYFKSETIGDVFNDFRAEVSK